MKNALIADPLQRDKNIVDDFFTDTKLSRAEYRRQQKEKNTVYRLTKAQILAIEKKAYKDAYDYFEERELKTRAEYEEILHEKTKEYKDIEKAKVINLVIAVSLKALHLAFGWKSYKGDRYQRYLIELSELLNSDTLDMQKERRWVLKTLGIELKEIEDDESSKKISADGEEKR